MVRAKLGFAEVLLVACVFAGCAVILVPIPVWLLDVLIVANLTAALAFLVATLSGTVDLRMVPIVLLGSTFSRLALNIASTRMILAEGEAGQVIATVGHAATAGDYFVGVVIFVAISLVQLVVVTRGASRIAEVTARFSLDALPGRQLALDAALRQSGERPEAGRLARERLLSESQALGALDGAMKFVQGDAMASLALVAINVVGGIWVGAVHQGLSVAESISVYVALSIGDGLVAQIPAIAVNLSAGLTVAGAGEPRAVATMAAHFVGHHLGALRLAALAVGAAGLLPGMPWSCFVVAAAFWGVTQFVENVEKVVVSAPAGVVTAPLTRIRRRLVWHWHAVVMARATGRDVPLRWVEHKTAGPMVWVGWGTYRAEFVCRDGFVAMPPEELAVLGITATPATGPAGEAGAWVDEDARGRLEPLGHIVWGAEAYLLARVANTVYGWTVELPPDGGHAWLEAMRRRDPDFASAWETRFDVRQTVDALDSVARHGTPLLASWRAIRRAFHTGSDIGSAAWRERVGEVGEIEAVIVDRSIVSAWARPGGIHPDDLDAIRAALTSWSARAGNVVFVCDEAVAAPLWRLLPWETRVRVTVTTHEIVSGLRVRSVGRLAL